MNNNEEETMNYKAIMQYINLPEGYKAPVNKDGNVDGNAFFIVGQTVKTLKQAGQKDIAKRLSEVVFKSEDYATLCAVCNDCVTL